MVEKIYGQYTPPAITEPVILESNNGYVPAIGSVILGGPPPPPPINFVFTYLDAKPREYDATNINFIFGGGELICPTSRNGYSNNFNCWCAPIISGTNNFEVSCDPNDFGFIEFAHGDSYIGDITRTSTADIHAGTSANTDIDYRTQLNLPVSMSYGSRITTANLSHSYYLNSSIGDGTSAHAIIDYRTQLNLPVNVTSGETLNANTSRTAGFEVTSGFGSSFSFNITPQYAVYLNARAEHGTSASIEMAIFPTTNMSVSGYYGNTSNALINIETTLSANAQYGHNINANLSTRTTVGDAGFFDGTSIRSDVEYVPPVTLDIDAVSGVLLNFEMASASAFKPINTIGENVLLDLSYFISTGSVFKGYTGSSLGVEIATYARIKADAYIGATLGTEIDIRPPKHLSANVYSGTVATASPNVTTGLSFGATSGENVDVTAIDNLKNTYMYVGENIAVELSSQTSLVNNNIAYGDNVKTELKTGPSEPLGTFTFAHGTVVEHIITTLISTTFQPRFSFDTEFVQTIWDTTFVDLNKQDCCPPKIEDLIYIDLQHDKEVEVRYDIPHDLSVTMDMRTNPIFYPNISHGTTFVVDDYDMLLNANFYYGEEADVLDLYNDLVVDLNSGNPEYGDDDVLIETNKDYTEFNNTFASIGDGTQVDIELCASYGLYGDMYHGEYYRPDSFVTERAWRINFTGLFGLRWRLNGNTQFRNIRGQMGDTTTLSGFYEEPLLFAYGESMYAELITDYDVEFVDDGCLDNGHMPTTSEGIPILDPTNEMAIEGKYYSRFIKGRCF